MHSPEEVSLNHLHYSFHTVSTIYDPLTAPRSTVSHIVPKDKGPGPQNNVPYAAPEGNVSHTVPGDVVASPQSRVRVTFKGNDICTADGAIIY